jgi:hypothetical protein
MGCPGRVESAARGGPAPFFRDRSDSTRKSRPGAGVKAARRALVLALTPAGEESGSGGAWLADAGPLSGRGTGAVWVVVVSSKRGRCARVADS